MTDGHGRLFVALELPDAVRVALEAWVLRLPVKLRRTLRPVTPEALHVTLCFLGGQLEQEIASIAAACDIVAAEPEVDLRLVDPVWLPRRRPRVLAIALEDGDGVLQRIQASLAAALAAGGWYQAETRPYLAHVTVARVKAGGGTRAGAGEASLRDITRAELPAVPRLRFRGSRLILYRSRLHRTGARYEALAGVTLRAPT